MSLTNPISRAAPATQAQLTDARFGAVAKATIHTARDVVVGPKLRDETVQRADVTTTITLDSGHAPFATAPGASAGAIAMLVQG